MSVLIKGMKMPKCCGECYVGFCKQIECELSIGFDGYNISRHPDCPLVPVPSHGRLIEKGVLLDKCYQHYEDFMLEKVDGKTALLNIEKEIKAAPTIIPAEEEKK